MGFEATPVRRLVAVGRPRGLPGWLHLGRLPALSCASDCHEVAERQRQCRILCKQKGWLERKPPGGSGLAFEEYGG